VQGLYGKRPGQYSWPAGPRTDNGAPPGLPHPLAAAGTTAHVPGRLMACTGWSRAPCARRNWRRAQPLLQQRFPVRRSPWGRPRYVAAGMVHIRRGTPGTMLSVQHGAGGHGAGWQRGGGTGPEGHQPGAGPIGRAVSAALEASGPPDGGGRAPGSLRAGNGRGSEHGPDTGERAAVRGARPTPGQLFRPRHFTKVVSVHGLGT